LAGELDVAAAAITLVLLGTLKLIVDDDNKLRLSGSRCRCNVVVVVVVVVVALSLCGGGELNVVNSETMWSRVIPDSMCVRNMSISVPNCIWVKRKNINDT